ncbi:hypothetical protein [uncultured Roseovarius sp.]|uniref:hypothetical protein n=1 Tax=uncultured Roseovarius sp. TaxID=293344 RepID=UPI00260D1D76|nr:hypothetical protein [uncultured Roseovarius sp.]
MDHVAIEILSDADLNTLLTPDEHLLWTGRPDYGRMFFQPTGAERTYLISMIVGALVMWSTLPFLDSTSAFGQIEAYWIYGATTLAFGAAAYTMACNRQYVLSNVIYFLTTKRAIVCRRGRNWRLGVRLYVVFNPHSATYPYEILPTRPNPSLRIGTLLDQQEVQPFGLGLSHPGQPVHWGKLTVPVAFEQVPHAAELLEIIRTALRP